VLLLQLSSCAGRPARDILESPTPILLTSQPPRYTRGVLGGRSLPAPINNEDRTMTAEKKPLTPNEMGRRGGLATLKRRGRAHYRILGLLSAAAAAKKKAAAARGGVQS
jgi:hypothetical protein